MERASNLKIFLLAVLFVLVVAASAWAMTTGLNLWSAAELACASKKTAGDMEMAKSNGCLEFWFNRYQAMTAGILAVFGAGLTLVAARWQVKAMRHQLDDTRFRSRKAANLRAFHALDLLYRDCCKIVVDIANLPSGMGAEHDAIRGLTLGDDFDALVPMSFEDTTELFELAREITLANKTNRDWLDIYGPDWDTFIQFKAAHFAQRAWKLRSRFASYLGWPHQMDSPFDMLRKLDKRHSEYAAEERARAASSSSAQMAK